MQSRLELRESKNANTDTVGIDKSWENASVLGNRADVSRLTLPKGLSLRSGEDEDVLVWRHPLPNGKISTVEFTVLREPKSNLAQQLTEIGALFDKDFTLAEAGNPVITAFFRLMLDRKDVGLRSLQDCSVEHAFIRSNNPHGTTSFESVTLRACSVALTTANLTLSNVKVHGGSSLEVAAKNSRFTKVNFAQDCVLRGHLGKAVIDADSEVHSYCTEMDFSATEWLISEHSNSINNRCSSAIFRMSMVTDKFKTDLKMVPLTAEQNASELKKIGAALDSAHG